MKRFFSKAMMFAVLSGFVYFWPFFAQSFFFDGPGSRLSAKPLFAQAGRNFSMKF